VSAEPAERIRAIDEIAIRAHAELIHSLASPLAGGKLILACFAEDPGQTNPKTGKPGLPLRPVIVHIGVGDTETTVRSIVNLTARELSNVYMPLAVFRGDLRSGGKGYEKDIAAVLGLVADFDDPEAAHWAERLPIPPNYVLETSAGRFQCFFLFDKPQPTEVAKAVAERLKAFARCDHGSSDMSHVWRVAGTLNWPNARKVIAGRSREPQLVRVALPWDGTLTSLEELAAALPPIEHDPGDEQNPKDAEEAPQADDSISVELLVRQLPPKLRARITEPDTSDRSKALFAVIKALGGRGFDAVMIERIIRAHPAGIGSKYADRHDLDFEIERVLSKPSRGSPAATEVSGKPIVYIGGGRLPTAIDEAEQHLMARDYGIFQRGDTVVRIAPSIIKIADGRQTIGLRLIQIRTGHMIERFTHWIDFQKYDARSEDYISIDCPANVAATYLERIGVWRLRVLSAITNCPTMRPDGTIIDSPGYDPGTGIFYDPRGVEFPPIPFEPTREQALTAIGELKSLFSEFPFIDGQSRSVATSGNITPVIRHALPTAPMHGFSATAAGSGKSKIVDTCSMIALGHAAPVTAQGTTAEETEKRLGAALIAGDAIISIDNCATPLSGQLLCQCLTQEVVEVRPLGKSELIKVPNTASFFSTGNNLVVADDMIRRTVIGALDPQCERPELREFTTEDPVKIVKRDRPKYVVAALTIVRAFIVAGRPRQTQPLGSFEEWSGLVRDALIWLGEPDPVATMERARREDPQLKALAEVIARWSEAIGTGEFTVKQVIDRATDLMPTKGPRGLNFNNLAHREFMFPEFREALLVVAGENGSVNSKRLGKWLGRSKGRIVKGMRIMEGLLERHWKVEPHV
jgi:hypothetical protein